MIFVTAGTQLPFDRLIEIIDQVSPKIKEEIIVQAIPGNYHPTNLKLRSLIPVDEFSSLVGKARLIIAHAGIGTILSSMLKQKPLIIFPRKGSLGEHRNDHQIETARRFEELGYVDVAWENENLKEKLFNPPIHCHHKITEKASPKLIHYVEDFIINSTKKSVSIN